MVELDRLAREEAEKSRRQNEVERLRSERKQTEQERQRELEVRHFFCLRNKEKAEHKDRFVYRDLFVCLSVCHENLTIMPDNGTGTRS